MTDAPRRSAVGQALAEALGESDTLAFTGDRVMVGWEETPLVLDALTSIGARVRVNSWEKVAAVGPDGLEVTITSSALVRDGARLLARALLDTDAKLDGSLPALLVESNLSASLERLNIDLGDVPWKAAGVPADQHTLPWALIALAESHAAGLPFGAPVPAPPAAEVLGVLLADAGESVDVYGETPYDFDDLWLLVLVVARDPQILTRARLLTAGPARVANVAQKPSSRASSPRRR